MVRYTKNFTRITNVKTKKRSWSAREKLAILAYLENKPSANKPLKRIRPQMKRLTPGAKPRYPILEDDLVIWVVSRFIVRSKTKSLAKTSRFLAIYPNIGDYKWSDKWLDEFMNCYHLSIRRCKNYYQYYDISNTCNGTKDNCIFDYGWIKQSQRSDQNLIIENEDNNLGNEGINSGNLDDFVEIIDNSEDEYYNIEIVEFTNVWN
ncbi:348_t:CDS:2 [Ambispora gerdemannii]|uniref:348_t:CDS:1 n=1 Tax=Ambispora gerdemannii TaxID=144530 RepID=A0A9N9APY5_9GLOM|nr:348_t:CDS:2 [Ambispora gerdemannii]